MSLKLKITLMLAMVYSHVIGQWIYNPHTVQTGYDWTWVGQSISGGYQYHLNSAHAIYGGIKYHLNITSKDRQSYVFKHTFRAFSKESHWGGFIGYKWSIPTRRAQEVFPFLFAEVRYSTKMGTRVVVKSFYEDLPDGRLLWANTFVDEENWQPLEFYVGLGGTFKIWKNLFLNAKFGMGPLLIILNYPPGVFSKTRYIDWDLFTHAFNVGLSYNFKRISFKS